MRLRCQECAACQQSPARRVYSEGCLWCGARYVVQLSEVYRGEALEAERLRVMGIWERRGHDREQLRARAMAGEIYDPATAVPAATPEPKRRIRGWM